MIEVLGFTRDIYTYITDVDECSAGTDSCSQICDNTVGSYTCSCIQSFSLDTDGRTCTEDATGNGCGGVLTAASGSFNTLGWPNSYPQEFFQCEWLVQIPDTGARIEFTIDDSAFGTAGRLPCTTDHIEFFDGSGTNTPSINRICGRPRFYDFNIPLSTTSSSEARVVFTGTDRNRPDNRVGVRVTYRTV